jgi:hypothetical protein
MKLFGRLKRWAVLGGLVLATSAHAQKEQWLEYHTTSEGRGYRYLDLTTNPPANVALPGKLNARPYFARWNSPLDGKDGSRWICFDRTRKSGPYDLVYFDSTGNGRLDDKALVKATRVEEYYSYFGPLKVVFKGEDGPIAYHLLFQFMKFESDDTRLLIRSAGYYGGTIEVAGKKRHLELIDRNVNGAFNDGASDSVEGDSVKVEGDKNGEHLLGKLLEVDNQFFRIEAARDGAFVKIQPADDVVLGKVRVPESISEFVAYGENGEFTRHPVKGELTLPAGSYRLMRWAIERKDAKGASWRLTAYGSDDSGKFKVGEAQPCALQVGEPIQMELKATELTNQVAFNLGFQAHYKEDIQFTKGEDRPPGPKMVLASLDGAYRSTNSFEFG